VEEPSAPRVEEERRRLWDRRSPEPRRGSTDRRARDRRRSAAEYAQERRSGDDRRKGDRRRAIERRALTDRRRGVRWRETPTPFTAEQLAQIRTLFAEPGPVRCPACGSRVALGWSRHTATEKARRVMCLGCGRGAVIPDPGAARILVVSANEALRDILQGVLTRAGHDVVEAGDGGVALFAYESAPADAVLVDIQAPGRMGTADFLRRLRAGSPDACVIALVPRASRAEAAGPGTAPEGRPSAPELEGLPRIHLPLSREELLRTVWDVCNCGDAAKKEP